MNEELKLWLSDFDAGKVVTSVEMGGLSESYEAAIQFLVIEVCRRLVKYRNDKGDTMKSNRINSLIAFCLRRKKCKDYGYFGAQVAVARHLAFRYWTDLPQTVIVEYRDYDKERIITMKKVDDYVSLIDYTPQSVRSK